MEDRVEKIVETLTQGGVVIMPSDTCYMLAVDGTNQRAVDKLLALKTGLAGKPISVVMADMEMAKEYVEINSTQERTINNLLPGPYTLILKDNGRMAKGVASLTKTLGIRITKNKKLQEIVSGLGRPITATSALLYGTTLPYSLGFIKKLSKEKMALIDLVVDEGKLPDNLPSMIMDISGGDIVILDRTEINPPSLGLWRGKQFSSSSEEQTAKIAKEIFGKQKLDGRPLVFLLLGDLGAGKTIFAKAIGKICGIKEIMNSPTFTTINEYKISFKNYNKLRHMDLYRINTLAEMQSLDLLNQIEEGVIVCLEWGEMLGQELMEKIVDKARVVKIEMEYVDLKSRKINWS